jgi:hypothetical protein
VSRLPTPPNEPISGIAKADAVGRIAEDKLSLPTPASAHVRIGPVGSIDGGYRIDCE